MIFNPLELQPRCALGRFAELFPYASAGFALALVMRECETKVVQLGLIGLGVVLLVLPLIFKLAEIDLSCSGFGYQGLELFCVVIAISILSILGGDACKIRRGSLVANVAGCTAGVYYIHLLVGKCIEVPLGRHRGLCEALMVSVASLLIVMLMKRIRGLAWLVK